MRNFFKRTYTYLIMETFSELEKKAFVEYYVNRLGTYMAKIANITGALQSTANAVSKPGLFGRLGRVISHPASGHLNEVAGLGVLAVPSAANLAGHPMSDHSAHATELAGLGILAGPSAYHAVKALRPTRALIRG